jgi:hypothetical protein
MRSIFRTLTLLILSTVLSNTPSWAARGTPQLIRDPGTGGAEPTGLAYWTYATDAKKLLRGARWSLDTPLDANHQPTCPLPLETDLQTMRDTLGVNTIHVYAESAPWSSHPQKWSAGVCVDQTAQLVDMADRNNLYVVLTIGNAWADCDPAYTYCDQHLATPTKWRYDSSYAQAFWTIYAQRFAGKTHVIFEIQNEPYWDNSRLTSQPTSADRSTLVSFEASLYTTIRTYALATPVLFFSYPTFDTFDNGQAPPNDVGVKYDVSALKVATGITFAKEAVAFHGYTYYSLAQIESTLQSVETATAPCVMTESYAPTGVGASTQDVNQTIMLEYHNTSWLSFLTAGGDPGFSILNSALYKTILDNAGVVWGADYGSWPAVDLTAPVAKIVSLKARSNSKYVTAPNSTTPLSASASTVTASEKFTILNNSAQFLSMRASSNNLYVGTPAAGANPLKAWGGMVGYWEGFEWMQTPDGSVVLRARSNNKIVSADPTQGNKLIANKKTAGNSEKFTITFY